MITPLPGATPTVPGSCTLPLPGIMAAIVDELGKDLPNGDGGMLVIKRPWPSHDPHDLGRPGALQEQLLPARSWAGSSIWPATPRSAAPTALTSASRAASTTC